MISFCAKHKYKQQRAIKIVSYDAYEIRTLLVIEFLILLLSHISIYTDTDVKAFGEKRENGANSQHIGKPNNHLDILKRFCESTKST